VAPAAVQLPAGSAPSAAPGGSGGGAWQLSPAAGERLLATLYGVAPAAEVAATVIDPCALAASRGLACGRGSAQTWDALLAEGRPLLLELRDESRFAARALFLGVSGDDAILADAAGLQRAPLGVLAQRWTGGYWYYWQRPDLGRAALSEGDSGEGVQRLARLFADLDGQPVPLTDTLFTPALAQRVRLFQRSSGLDADGVAGEQTLRALVLAAGADLDREAARERIATRAAAGQWP
jgi:general secretion pathway protein A